LPPWPESLEGSELGDRGPEDPWSLCLAKGSRTLLDIRRSGPVGSVFTPEDASTGPGCPDFLRRPRATRSVRTGVLVLSSTVRRGFRCGPRTTPSAPAGAFRFPHTRRRWIRSTHVPHFRGARRHRFRSARSHWFRPTQARWFPVRSEDRTIRRRRCFGSGTRPRTLPFPAATHWILVAPEDATFLRRRCFGSRRCPRTPPFPAAFASRSPCARRRRVRSTRCAFPSGCPKAPVGSRTMGFHVPASEDAGTIPPGCASLSLRPRAKVSVSTACWVPPALLRRPPAAPEGAAFFRRDAFRSPCARRRRVPSTRCAFPSGRPKAPVGSRTVGFHVPASEDAGTIPPGRASFRLRPKAMVSVSTACWS
jgi:hypothetical protein